MESTPLSSCNESTLTPYIDSGENPWNTIKIKHAYRRLGFGTSQNNIDNTLELSPDECIENIVNEAINKPPTPTPFWADYAFSDFTNFEEENPQYVEGWKTQTVNDLINENLRGRLTFFWMNHFVTELDGYGSYAPYMFQYYNLMQTHALGNFKEFVRAVGVNSTMLIYLNGFENTSNNPNENYARELFKMLENLPEDSDFPHWWQSKVTKSLQMLSKAKHYLENEIAVPEATQEAQDNMGFTDKQIKMAYGVLNDTRYKAGNMTGAVEVINKIAPGLADHPGVAKALQRTNEAFKESVDLSDKDLADAVFKAIDLANSLDVHYAVDKVAEFAEDLYSAVNGANEAVCSECKKPRFVAMPESIRQQYESVNEAKQKGVDGKVCWKGYKRMGTKKKGGKTVDNCVKM